MIFRSPYPDVVIPDISLSSFLLPRVESYGERIAFVDTVTGKETTYHQFHAAVLRVAHALSTQFAFQKGDVFAIFAPNCVEYAIAFQAVCLLGGIITTVNPLSTAAELASQLRDSGARFLLTSNEVLETGIRAASQSNVERVYVSGTDGRAAAFSDLMKKEGTVPDTTINPKEDVAAMPYSSGTTGLPKGVMLTHRNLVANLLQIETSVIFHPHDVVMFVLPLFHIYGLMVILNEGLYLGCTLIMMPKYGLDPLLQNIQKYRVTIAPLVPPIILALAKQPAVESFDLSSLKTIFSAAAPLAIDLIDECQNRIGAALKQGYGMTEASPATHMERDDPALRKRGSVGVCVSNTECRIVDEAGNECGPSQQGELYIRGPQVMKGYLNRPDATTDAIDREGWLRTGDIGYADQDGNFFIVDRVKELIKYKGYQVAPAEIESVLLSHPMVGDAAVIPSADPEAGEVPKAFVVLKSDVDLDEIQSYVAARVAPYKRIRKIERIDQIPKSPSGKILRRILVQKERGN